MRSRKSKRESSRFGSDGPACVARAIRSVGGWRRVGPSARPSCAGLLGVGLGTGWCAAACGWRPSCRALSEKARRGCGPSPLKHWGNAYLAKVPGARALFHVMHARGGGHAPIRTKPPPPAASRHRSQPSAVYQADKPPRAGPEAQLRRKPTAPNATAEASADTPQRHSPTPKPKTSRRQRATRLLRKSRRRHSRNAPLSRARSRCCCPGRSACRPRRSRSRPSRRPVRPTGTGR